MRPEADTESKQTLASAMDNTGGIERDMKELGRFVREKLFYLIVHDLKDDSSDVLKTDGRVCNASIQYFLQASMRGKITNKYILEASEKDFHQYLRFMWTQGQNSVQKERVTSDES
jgi:hypothetical protein